MIFEVVGDSHFHLEKGGLLVTDTENITCPKCDSHEIGEGKHANMARMIPVAQFGVVKGASGSDIRYRVCTECGYIVEGYVEKPEKFKWSSAIRH